MNDYFGGSSYLLMLKTGTVGRLIRQNQPSKSCEMVGFLCKGQPVRAEIFAVVIEDQTGKQHKMDHRQVRYPTNFQDVARVLFDLSYVLFYFVMNDDRSITLADLSELVPSILHFASPAPPMTKHDMTRIIAFHLKLPIHHIIPDTSKPDESLVKLLVPITLR